MVEFKTKSGKVVNINSNPKEKFTCEYGKDNIKRFKINA